MKIQKTVEAEAAIAWAKNEIANDPDGNRDSDTQELESAYAAIFGESFPCDDDRDEQADPRGFAMWSAIRSALNL